MGKVMGKVAVVGKMVGKVEVKGWLNGPVEGPAYLDITIAQPMCGAVGWAMIVRRGIVVVATFLMWPVAQKGVLVIGAICIS